MAANVQSDSRCVLALSGGIDSRVLLHLFARYVRENGCPAVVVHVHHGLSPSADQWVDRCRQWCIEEALPFQVEYVVVDKTGESLEAAARRVRYQALQRYIGEGDRLLTGQHRDDQLETFLLALKRGSGPKGLSCMAESMPFGRGRLLRPLLTVSRADIEVYATSFQLTWVEDESNQDTRFDRNFIRHDVVPLLVSRWPDFPQAVQRSAELCASQEALLNELLQDLYLAALQTNHSLSVHHLLTCRESARAQILRMWLHQLGHPMPSRIQLSNIDHQVLQARADANPKLRFGEHEIRRFDGFLFCIPVYPDISDWQCQIKLNQSVELPDGLGTLTLTETSSDAGLNRQCLAEPLRITFNPEGLMASPLGRKGRHKLKKLFQEYRIPSWQRRRIPILMSGKHVVAVANLFVDKHFSGSDCDLIWDTMAEFMSESGQEHRK
ncbi:tRNA(Ile)-lysidine synthase [Vibrio mangrovi]|nr:tRNA(Ile)-lysidine synthase [Vibrio mangrovi]